MAIRFSVAPVNWTNDDDPSLGGEIPLEQCLAEMREAGYAGAEMGNKFPREVSDLKACLARFDLALTTDWIGTSFTVSGAYDQCLEQFKERVQFLKHFGVEALKVCECGHSIQQSSKPIFRTGVEFSSEQWRALIKGLHDASVIAADAGMYVAYHHHLGTGVETASQISRLMENTDEEKVTLLPDTGHLYAADVDPFATISRYRSRIKYVHLKDVRADVFSRAKNSDMNFMDAVRAGLFTVPSDGCIDFASIFSLLKQTDYAGWLVVEAEQDPKKAEPLTYAKKARDFLRTHFGY